MKPFSSNVTAWAATGSASEQGVRQVSPCVVRTEAPGGADSNCKACAGGGAGLKDSQSGT
jgi:hypothetical protein